MFADPRLAYIHIRSAANNCYQCRLERDSTRVPVMAVPPSPPPRQGVAVAGLGVATLTGDRRSP